ncbi:hypothetical protein [Acidovorax sp. SUPP3334]|uniref:hypothetical protein n=1 Tax=Acidovorax sp. SUPP3334 TaxID=2920881 RepID=UPI0023DE3501|nr:hypothetical protein [Acidovorax sp. SUPP3334]GKT21642.1 hypothetical protein AVHM3334_05490 [Acidovorax sp. SUPP3334]
MPIYLAWGRGLPQWDAQIEPEPTTSLTLVDEIGRRLATSVQFAEPHADGEIELPDASRYRVSVAETKWLYVTWVFNYADAAGETVRELGVFLGGELVAGLPPGQRYFTAAQVAQPGDLYTMERFDKFTRSASTRQVQAFVLPF